LYKSIYFKYLSIKFLPKCLLERILDYSSSKWSTSLMSVSPHKHPMLTDYIIMLEDENRA